MVSRKLWAKRRDEKQRGFVVLDATDTTIRDLVLTLDHPGFLVLRLALLRPFWCDIDTILFFLIALFLGLVNRSGLMLSWAVHGIEDQRCRPRVHELVLGTSWDDDKIASLDVLVFACNGGFAYAGCESEDLVDCVYLHMLDQGQS